MIGCRITHKCGKNAGLKRTVPTQSRASAAESGKGRGPLSKILI